VIVCTISALDGTAIGRHDQTTCWAHSKSTSSMRPGVVAVLPDIACTPCVPCSCWMLLMHSLNPSLTALLSTTPTHTHSHHNCMHTCFVCRCQCKHAYPSWRLSSSVPPPSRSRAATCTLQAAKPAKGVMLMVVEVPGGLYTPRPQPTQLPADGFTAAQSVNHSRQRKRAP
jgi:hypothetical protein